MNSNNRKYPSLEEFFPDDYESYPDQEFDTLKEFEESALKELRREINEKIPNSVFEDLEYEEDYKKAYAGYGSTTEPAEVILRIKGEAGFCDVLSINNFSTVTGKPKSKKSMLILLIISWFAAPKKNNHIVDVSETEKKLILIFDTEQSKDIVERIPYKIAELSNLEKALNVEPFSIRCFSPEKRLQFIIDTIKRKPDTLIVVIDGIRDLIYDINNIAESSILVTELLNLASKNKIHIINVVHQNKSDSNARGHLGSELNFKSEVIISVTKKTDKISVVSCSMTRKKGFNSFQFEVGPNGLPYLIETTTDASNKKRTKFFRYNKHDDKFHKNLLDGIFKGEEITGYDNLIKLIGTALMNLGYDLNSTTADNVVRKYLSDGKINKKGDNKHRIYYL